MNHLRIHVVDVDHGDAIILEFPDYDGKVHFGIVDTGRPENRYKNRLADYLEALIDLRDEQSIVHFVCVTHPHEDHYGGLGALLSRLPLEDRGAGKPDRPETIIRQFWDCGFRTSAKTYNGLLDDVASDQNIVFMRLAAGMEFRFGDTEVYVIAPSVDLRNRFDTFGVNRNNASIVLRLKYGRSTAILAGDAQFDSWGKVAEEFPRTSTINFHKDALPQRSEGSNQLKCQLLKVSHHGSKHGTSLEYLEKLGPKHFMITCADRPWYEANRPTWGTDWPHPLTDDAIEELTPPPDLHVRRSFEHGNVVYHLRGGRTTVRSFKHVPDPDDSDFVDELENALDI